MAARRELKRCLRHIGNIPLSSPEFRKLEETRATIMGSGPLLPEVRDYELDSVEREWTRSFVRSAEIAEDAEELAPGIEALTLFFDAYDAARPRELQHLHRVNKLSHFLLTVLTRLKDAKPAALPMGGPVLLAHYDTEIAALEANLSGDEPPVVLRHIRDYRQLYPRMFELDAAGNL